MHNYWGEKRWIDSFTMDICAIMNAASKARIWTQLANSIPCNPHIMQSTHSYNEWNWTNKDGHKKKEKHTKIKNITKAFN